MVGLLWLKDSKIWQTTAFPTGGEIPHCQRAPFFVLSTTGYKLLLLPLLEQRCRPARARG